MSLTTHLTILILTFPTSSPLTYWLKLQIQKPQPYYHRDEGNISINHE